MFISFRGCATELGRSLMGLTRAMRCLRRHSSSVDHDCIHLCGIVYDCLVNMRHVCCSSTNKIDLVRLFGASRASSGQPAKLSHIECVNRGLILALPPRIRRPVFELDLYLFLTKLRIL
jgi:hypothetical protein